MIFFRRLVAACLVAAPSAAGVLIIAQWMPLPDPIAVQWSGTDVTTSTPLWLFFLPLGTANLAGLILALAAALDRDRTGRYCGTLFVAAVLTAGSTGLCLAVSAVNLGLTASTALALLSSLALAPIYALLPLAVVAACVRAPSPATDDTSRTPT